MQHVNQVTQGIQVQERSISNPFSAKSPLEAFGALRKDATGKGFQYEGLPYVGPPFPFKDDDPEEYRPELKHNACAAQFDLSNPEDMAQYRAVSQKVCDSLAVISYEEKIYDDAIKSWRILMRWMEPYYAPPPAAQEIIKDLKNQDNPSTMQIAPETDLRKPVDHAKAVADNLKAAAEEQQEPDDGTTRYRTIDEAINGAGKGFLLDADPESDDPEGSDAGNANG